MLIVHVDAACPLLSLTMLITQVAKNGYSANGKTGSMTGGKRKQGRNPQPLPSQAHNISILSIYCTKYVIKDVCIYNVVCETGT